MTREISRERFDKEVRDWAERLRVSPTRVQVRKMTRFWGSCTSRGTVTFSDDLLRRPKAFRSAVIVHELLHLIVPNHGKVFKALMRTYLGRMVVTDRGSSCRAV
jgi:predicted metal-dependent hydrolase